MFDVEDYNIYCINNGEKWSTVTDELKIWRSTWIMLLRNKSGIKKKAATKAHSASRRGRLPAYEDVEKSIQGVTWHLCKERSGVRLNVAKEGAWLRMHPRCSELHRELGIAALFQDALRHCAVKVKPPSQKTSNALPNKGLELQQGTGQKTSITSMRHRCFGKCCPTSFLN